ELGEGRAPGLARRAFAAGQGDRGEVRRALDRADRADDELAAPERAVGPAAAAVPDDPDGAPGKAVLREAAREVRVVVEHLQGWLTSRELARVAARGVVEPGVVDEPLGERPEEGL